MPEVISNSSPIIHLAKIGRLELLESFFGVVTIPSAVYDECVTQGGGREEVKDIENASWLRVEKASDQNLVTLLRSELDRGEAEAIALALERNAALILLDDAEGREKARLYDLPITGTVGLLLRAKREGLLGSFGDTLLKLRQSGFWMSDALAERLRNEVEAL